MDKTLNVLLAKVSNPYKKFKKMYTIDSDLTSEYKGKLLNT